MTPHFSRRYPLFALVMVTLAAFLLASTRPVAGADGIGKSSLMAEKPISHSVEPAPASCGSGEFSKYRVNATGFTKEQQQIILQTLFAFAEALGSPEQLGKLLTVYNGIPCQEIFFDPNGVGAQSDIRLTPTVFNIRKALAAHYDIYFASGEESHARIVIGHEIGHLLNDAATRKTGLDWRQEYRTRVRRNWQTGINHNAFEEEAVTQISLEVQSMGYYYSILDLKMESNPQRKVEIQAWVSDFLAALQKP